MNPLAYSMFPGALR